MPSEKKLDHLLDIRYTKEKLKEMIDELSVGQEVQFTNDCLSWIKKHAYYMHTVGAMEEGGVIMRDSAEGSFFVDLYIGNGFQYKAEILQFIDDVGDNTPGARLKITLPNGLERTSVYSVIDFF